MSRCANHDAAGFHGYRAHGGKSRRRAWRSSDRCGRRARRNGGRASRKPYPRVERSDRACRNAGDPRRCRSTLGRAPRQRRPLCDARTLHHVRGRDFLRAHPQALLRRRRRKGGRSGQRRALLSIPHVSPCARRSIPALPRRNRPTCCAASFGSGGADGTSARPLFRRPAAAGLPSAEAFHRRTPRTALARPKSPQQAGRSRGHPGCQRARRSDAGGPPLR